MIAPDIQELVKYLSKLPGLGPRSGRRAALHLMKKPKEVMRPLMVALERVLENIKSCTICGNLDTTSPCTLCQDPKRDETLLCVVAEVADLWALERAPIFRGRYHVLGGILSALEGQGPEDLRIGSLVKRVQNSQTQEVILGLSATVEGQTTAHYIVSQLKPYNVKVTRLSHGVPVGGELDYMDEGTLETALLGRRHHG